MLAAEVSDQMSPSIDRLRIAVAKQQRFTVSNFGINEDGDLLGSIGLRCEEEPSMRKPVLSFGIVITQLNSTTPKTARGRVLWSIPWIRDKQDGFMAYEAGTPEMTFEGPRLPERLVSALPRLEAAFIGALERGRPPGTLTSVWRLLANGLPMPEVIRLRKESTPPVGPEA